MKSTFILDLIALVPQFLRDSGTTFLLFKNIRLYQIWLLYYPPEWATRVLIKCEYQIKVFVFAFATFSCITVLLHSLGCLFIYIGSERYNDYEVGAVPWILANEDFHGMSDLSLIVFADYWVCTVITTVGYGDYSGGTSIEYMFSIAIEFFGFVIFATL